MKATEVNKAIMAGVALAVVIAQANGWEVPEDIQEALIQLVLYALGVFGVYQIPNTPPEDPIDDELDDELEGF